MAMKTQTGDRPAPSKETGPLSQSERWVRFGSNVALALVLATVLAVAAVWLSEALLRGRARSDWTAAGRFSLSPRTKALVADIPSDCDIRLTNLYSHAPEIPASEEQWQRVQDLLSEYEMASPRIALDAVDPNVDVGQVETLVNRLRTRYEKELEKPKALVAEFGRLRTDLGAVLKAEADRASAAADAWTDGPTEVVNSLRMVSQRWQQLETLGTFTAAAVQSLTDQALPAYSTALGRAKDFLGPVGDNFEAVPPLYKQLREAAKDVPVPPEAREILASAEAVYGPLVGRIKAFTKQAADLPELELDKVRDQIGEGEAILIETPTRVQVVSFDDVWVRNRAGGEEEQPERLFAGEQAVSSALLGLLHADKPAVLFVTFGEPATMWGGPYAEMAERIRKANFIVEDWNLARDPAMPAPEHMTFPILVLVPPAPPNPQMPMPPPSPELYATAVEAIKKGAAAIIFGEPASMFGPAVPYRDLFDTFGLEGRFEAVAVRKVVVDQRGTERAVPQIEITRYPEHPITAPLGALPTMLVTAMPVMPKAALPEGVTVQPILTLPVGADYWADTTAMEAMRGEAKRDEAEDLIPTEERPVVLAAAATRELTPDQVATSEPGADLSAIAPAVRGATAEAPGEQTGARRENVADRSRGRLGKIQKVVFFGDGDFASDRVAFYRTMFGQQVFPGNAELFLNSLLWVAGTEHLITVSPEALEARRIGDLSGWTLPLRILIIAGLPLAAGIVGLIVYIVRRR